MTDDLDPFGATIGGGTLDLPASDQVARGGDLDPGQLIGHFVIRSRLGEGGMGIVLAAHDPDLGRDVAIKIVKTADDHPAYRARLLREAKVMAALEHPNIVRVHEVGTDARGRLYVAMQLVDGVTLATWLKVQRRGWREILAMFEHVGRGLAAVHAAGLVHRDFKPDNVLVDRDGRPRVADFGLARADRNASTELGATLTRTGMMIGTPGYMAPEQHYGDRVDARADQYAFCLSLRDALIGHRPATIEDAHWGDVPRAVRAAIDKGASVDVTERFPSMEALLDALARGARRRSIVLGATAAGVIAVGGLVAFAIVSATATPSPPPRATAALTPPPPTPVSPPPVRVATDDSNAGAPARPNPYTPPVATPGSSAKTVDKPKSPKPVERVATKPPTAIGGTVITPMAPVAPTEAAKQHNLDGGKPKTHEMVAAHRTIVRDAVRDFGFGGVTITPGDLDADRRDLQAKIDASTDDLERGILFYGMGQLERSHGDCVAASKQWMEARTLIGGVSRGPIDSEQARKRRDQAFRFYGRVMIGEAFCDLQTGRALGVDQKLLKGLRNLFGVTDGERAESWFAMGIALVETGELERGREMLLQAARRGRNERLIQAIESYANAVGVKL